MSVVDIFIKIDGIDGESQDDKHKNEIDVLSWSWGAAQSGTMAYGGGGGAGKVQFENLQFTHHIDKSTPKLNLACWSGQHIPAAMLVVRKAGGDQQEYLKIKLTDCLVTHVQQSSAANSEIVPSESVALNFSKVEINYAAQEKSGALGAAASASWDVKANKKA